MCRLNKTPEQTGPVSGRDRDGPAAATGDSWPPLPVPRAASPSPPRTLAMGLKRPIHLTCGSMAACSTVPACGNGSGQARLQEPL